MTDTTTTTRHWDYLCQTATFPGYYGLGDTVEDAKAQCKAHGGRLTRYVVYRLPEQSTNPYCDQMTGQVRWSMPESYDGPHIIDLEVVAKRGV